MDMKCNLCGVYVDFAMELLKCPDCGELSLEHQVHEELVSLNKITKAHHDLLVSISSALMNIHATLHDLLSGEDEISQDGETVH